MGVLTSSSVKTDDPVDTNVCHRQGAVRDIGSDEVTSDGGREASSWSALARVSKDGAVLALSRRRGACHRARIRATRWRLLRVRTECSKLPWLTLPLHRLPADVAPAKTFRPFDAIDRRIGARLRFRNALA